MSGLLSGLFRAPSVRRGGFYWFRVGLQRPNHCEAVAGFYGRLNGSFKSGLGSGGLSISRG